jgi:hypothetical protein
MNTVKIDIKDPISDNVKELVEEIVIVIPCLTMSDQILKDKAQKTIDLYRLNTRYYNQQTSTLTKPLEEIGEQDVRLFHRTAAWKTAKQLSEDTKIQQACAQFEKSDQRRLAMPLRFVSTVAIQTGFWSIWMSVFWQAFKNVELLRALFVEAEKWPEDMVFGYQGRQSPPDGQRQDRRRPSGSMPKTTYLHFAGTAKDRILAQG